MKTKIISANPGGIANRVKCLVSMWRLSDNYNKKLYLHWKKNDRCGAEFNKLFENEFDLISDDELNNLKNEMVSQTYRFIPLPGEVPDGFAKVYSTKRGNNIEFEFDRIPVNVRENILSYLRKLKPVKVISSTVDKFTAKHDVLNLIGVHIRRDDFLVGKEGLGKVSSDDKFIEKMNDILRDNPSARFFLCTDCQDTEDKFIKEFGDKIIIYSKKNRDRASTIATQQGLVDLLLLSKTKHMLSTYCSTFNELAWWMGGCNAKVEIVMDDNLNKQYKTKKSKMEKSCCQRFKKFVYNILCKVRVFKK